MAMNLPRHLLKPDAKILRQFAWGWLVFFLGLGVYEYGWRGHSTRAWWLFGIAVAGTLLSWLLPVVFRWIFVVWMLLAFPIGWVVSQISLALMFYGIITPVALLFRWRGRDRMRRFKPAGVSSYWAVKETPSDLRRYFRQY